MFEREYHAIPEDFEGGEPIPSAHHRFFWPAVSAVLMAALLASDAVHSEREVALRAELKQLKALLRPLADHCADKTEHREIMVRDTAITHSCHWTVWRY